MHSYKLPSLSKNKTIGFISPASPVKPEQVKDALTYLQNRGFKYKMGKHAFSDNGLTAAPVKERIQDIEAFWEDDQISIVWSLRGGYGAIQLLDKLDYQLLQKTPKIIIGFSDVTALQWALAEKIDLPTISGLTLTTQVNKSNPYISQALKILSGEKTSITLTDIGPEQIVVRQSGNAKGILMGGTLSMICSLCGTSYWLNKDRIILFLEDVNEPLYRIDRYFRQLRLTGFWEKVCGVILGKFVDHNTNSDVLPLLLPLLPPSIPIIENFPYGHFRDCYPLPLSIKATLETDPFKLSWPLFIQKI